MANRTLNVAIVGATGRMGNRLITLIGQDDALALAAAVDRPDHPRLGEDVGPSIGLGPLGVPLSGTLDRPCDVVIDFSTPSGTLKTAEVCVEKGIPLVVGTTGFDPPRERPWNRPAIALPC